MADTLQYFQPGSSESVGGRQRMPGWNNSIELAPDKQHRNFELTKPVDEDGSLSLAGKCRGGNGLDGGVRARCQASRIHLIDTAVENESTFRERERGGGAGPFA